MADRWSTVRRHDGEPAPASTCRGLLVLGFLIAALLGLADRPRLDGLAADPEPVRRVGAEVRMSATVGDLNPKTLENAKRQFVELYGSALVLNTYLKIALVLVSLVALGLLGLNVHTAARYADVKPLVIRIDDVGRAEAVAYDASRYQPQPPELRYFLTQFVVKHFSRIRATVQREYPDSLLFLEPALADATIAQNDQSRGIETFVTNPSADEIDVVVQNVSLSELTTTPFKAAINFQKVFYTPGHAARAGRETFVAQVDFVAARPRAERVRPGQSAWAAGCLLPRRPGVRGGGR